MKKSSERYIKNFCVAVFCLLTVAAALSVTLPHSRAQSGTTYFFAELPSRGGDAKALAINNCGQVVGASATTGSTPMHPVLWSNGSSGQVTDLGTFGGNSANDAAYAINSSGVVVGTASDSTGHPFRWSNGNLQKLSNSNGIAFGINDAGKVVGTVLDESDPNGTGNSNAFTWDNGTLQIVPGSNGITPQYAQAINNSGTIVGLASVSPVSRAFLLKNGTLTNLGALGGNISSALGVSESDIVVGYSYRGDSSLHAFIWRNATDGMVDLQTLSGGANSIAYDINVNGIAVGYSEVTGGASHAFVYDATQGMRDLNSPSITSNVPTGWVLQEARGINDSGQIVGTAIDGSGKQHAFLLTPNGFTPTPCPSTVTVAVSPSSVTEDGASNLSYTFTRGSTGSALTVKFSVGGTATFPTDYSQTGATTFGPSSGTLTFGAGELTKTVTIDPTPDSTVEPDETVVLTLASGSDYIIGTPDAATGTITNDDADVTVLVSPLSVTEDSANNLVYTFTRSSGPTTNALTVNFSVTGTATTTDNDFTILPTSVTIPAGSTSASVTVVPIADSKVEPDETVVLTVAPGTGYSIGSPDAATGTITNDDTDVSVAVSSPSPASVTESGPTNLIYTFTRNGVTNGSLPVNFSVSGTATFGSDYSMSGATSFDATSRTGTVTIPAGSTSANVVIDPAVDGIVEGNETVVLTVTSGAGYNVAATNSSATGTITDTPAIYTTDGVNAVALDSVTFAAGPFRLVDDFNFSSDHVTRVILFTSDLGINAQNPPASAVGVHVNGDLNSLPIENVGPVTGVPGFTGSYIIVQLPPQNLSMFLVQGQPKTDLMITVTLGNATSNTAILSIAP